MSAAVEWQTIRVSVQGVIEYIAEFNSVWLLIPAIFFVFILSALFPLSKLGLVPRQTRGAPGIVTMPFLHEDARHLWTNLGPLVVLLAFLVALRGDVALLDTCQIQLLGGALLWLTGRRANHIGASLLVFGLAGFHIANGMLQGKFGVVVVAILTAVLFGGSLLRNLMPWRRGTSWDGHLCGCIAGVALAVFHHHPLNL